MNSASTTVAVTGASGNAAATVVPAPQKEAVRALQTALDRRDNGGQARR